MPKYQIIATHPAFGTVTFVFDAPEPARAFQLWKSIVYSGRQWVVKSNTEADAPQVMYVEEE